MNTQTKTARILHTGRGGTEISLVFRGTRADGVHYEDGYQGGPWDKRSNETWEDCFIRLVSSFGKTPEDKERLKESALKFLADESSERIELYPSKS